MGALDAHGGEQFGDFHVEGLGYALQVVHVEIVAGDGLVERGGRDAEPCGKVFLRDALLGA